VAVREKRQRDRARAVPRDYKLRWKPKVAVSFSKQVLADAHCPNDRLPSRYRRAVVGVEESRSLTARRACPHSGICVFVIVDLLPHNLQKWKRSFQGPGMSYNPGVRYSGRTVYTDMVVDQHVKLGAVHELKQTQLIERQGNTFNF